MTFAIMKAPRVCDDARSAHTPLRQFWRALSFAFVGVIPAMTWAQSVEPKQGAYLFCTVTDIGTTPVKVWASAVLTTDISANQRSNELAADFLRRVNALGGAGNKMCLVSTNRAELETLREQQRASYSGRFLLMKVGDWRDVDWTPAPWNPATAAVVPAQVTRWFYCSANQFYSPGCSSRSCAVASQVFSMQGPSDIAAATAQTQAYSEAFKTLASGRGVSDEGASCQDFDTRAEADKSFRDNRNMFDGFNQKYAEIAWVPSVTSVPAVSPSFAAPVASAASAATQAVKPATAPAAVASPSATAAVVESALYCIAFIQREKPALLIRTPIRKEVVVPKSYAEMSASLSELFAAVQKVTPDDWHDLSKVQCSNNGAAFNGETFCFSIVYKRFSGGMQQLGSFCNPSRELIDEREKVMAKGDGGHAQIFPWPEKP